MKHTKYRNISKIGAAFLGAAVMLPATFSLAWPGDDDDKKDDDKKDDDKKDDVRFEELDAKRWGDAVKVFGVLDGHAHDVEVKVKVSGVVKELCYNPAGKLVWEQSRVWDFTERESVYIGDLHDDEKFHIEVDVDRGHHHEVKCPNKKWSSDRKVIVEDVHVKVVTNDDWGDDRKILETAECEFEHHWDNEAWCDYDDDKYDDDKYDDDDKKHW